MRIVVFYIGLFCTLFLSCDNDDYPHSEIPSVVLNSFHMHYPDASDVDFQNREQHYYVEFEIGQEDWEAVIDPAGSLLKSKEEISWNHLPAEVRSSLESEYGEKKIDDIEIITAGEEVYYQVEVDRFFVDKKLVINSEGKPDASLDYWD